MDSENRFRRERIVLVTILTVHVLLIGWGAWVHSPTVDEPAYLASGISHWRLPPGSTSGCCTLTESLLWCVSCSRRCSRPTKETATRKVSIGVARLRELGRETAEIWPIRPRNLLRVRRVKKRPYSRTLVSSHDVTNQRQVPIVVHRGLFPKQNKMPLLLVRLGRNLLPIDSNLSPLRARVSGVDADCLRTRG